MPTLNIGVLAHVDAGKTSLTERLLFDTGAIGRLGSVDAGSTQTDTGDLERSRGITIRSAVAPFHVGDLQVNLIDTPGHADFVAEVERALGVLDGAVLVLSAVEGVQAHTRVLARTLRRLRLPTLLFVNKVDRAGARPDALLGDIRRRLWPHVLPMSAAERAGTPSVRVTPLPPHGAEAAEVLAEHDDELLADLVAGPPPDAARLDAAVAAQTAAGLICPVYFGSALGGQGIGDLVEGIRRYLPVPPPATGGPAQGTVFAIERGPAGEKIAYVRLRSGGLRVREHVTYRRHEPGGSTTEHTEQITALTPVGRPDKRLTAGDIARIRGLSGVRVGDQITPHGHTTTDRAPEAHFARPSLATVVRPERARDAARLRAALLRLADEDPLIRARSAPDGATSLLLYGEVQKEVIAARLAGEFGVTARFEPSSPVYSERPAGVGGAIEEMDFRRRTPDFWATVGLRVEPGAPGSGVTFRREVELGALPLAFDRAIEETVHETLDQGLYGWPVTDCAVTLTASGFGGPVSTAADFRGLTPLVLMRALRLAGTRVYEPYHAFELEIPAETLGPVLARLSALGAQLRESVETGAAWTVEGRIPARSAHAFQRELPGLSHGEGVWWSTPSGDRPLPGTPPVRPRTDGNPLDRDAYLRHLARR
ncbi:GTP-binding protein [Spongiactinospora rosea]|uniref:GTP-binding protein n=1 Tax=Spongiactinospora rosea TaxID=2248750 RepID=A0A366M5J7_9ACTN|nr:TetM/TetW/TetO/TetS family tetracycline resistance ribosomal protection protein [Spongiactinospora rosea]RBQ21475.1 GTP-binding protein [Spongiactinospora rosea]